MSDRATTGETTPTPPDRETNGAFFDRRGVTPGKERDPHMAIPLYVTGLVMALFTLAIVVAMLRMRKWKTYEPTGESDGDVFTTLSNLMGSDELWTIGFLVVLVALVIGAVRFAGGEMVAISQGLAQTIVLGGLGALLVLFVFLGTYFSVRERGGPSSQGVAIASILIGLLVLVVIAAQLLGVA